MAYLQRVKRLEGPGTVPGYRTLNALGSGTAGHRGLLYHRLFSSQAPGFISEAAETQAALAAVGQALAPLGVPETWLVDSGFDDRAVWDTIWNQGQHLVCRVQQRDRLVETPHRMGCHLHERATDLRLLATVEAELVVQKGGQRQEKLQPVTVRLRAAPLQRGDRHAIRTQADGEPRTQALQLVTAELAHVARDAWWLLTDHPVETADQARSIFRMYCMRWAVEDAFKTGKTVPRRGECPTPGLRCAPSLGRLPAADRRLARSLTLH